MSQTIDMFVMGGVVGTGAGFVLGYATRALRSFVQGHRDEVRDINDNGVRRTMPRHRHRAKAPPSFISLPQHEQVLQADKPVSLEEAERFGEEWKRAWPDISAHMVKSQAPVTDPNRVVIIDALVSAGYKKSVATKAVDACPDVERSTAERWTVAALQKAMRL